MQKRALQSAAVLTRLGGCSGVVSTRRTCHARLTPVKSPRAPWDLISVPYVAALSGTPLLRMFASTSWVERRSGEPRTLKTPFPIVAGATAKERRSRELPTGRDAIGLRKESTAVGKPRFAGVPWPGRKPLFPPGK